MTNLAMDFQLETIPIDDQDFAVQSEALHFDELHELPVHELSDQLLESHCIPDHDFAPQGVSLQDFVSHP